MEVENPRLKGTLGILLADRFHTQPSIVDHGLHHLVVVGFVTSDPGLLGDQHMDHKPVEVAPFADLMPAPDFPSIAPRAVVAVVVAACHRHAVEDLDELAVEFLPGFSQ